MPVVEASVDIRLSPDEVWFLMYGDEMAHVTKLTESITAVRDYRMREDGTPIYRMYHKQGPMRFSEISDYTVFEAPRLAVNRVTGSPIGGTYTTTLEARDGGTRMTHRWELAANVVLIKPFLPLIAKMLQRAFDRTIPSMGHEMPAVLAQIRGSDAGR
jgi:hypothetical protein